jgi:hypothetical protein
LVVLLLVVDVFDGAIELLAAEGKYGSDARLLGSSKALKRK